MSSYLGVSSFPKYLAGFLRFLGMIGSGKSNDPALRFRRAAVLMSELRGLLTFNLHMPIFHNSGVLLKKLSLCLKRSCKT